MKLETKKLLFDVQRACGLILTFSQGRAFNDYANDVFLRSAVERQFEITGEALHRLERADPATLQRISEHRSIIDFRNIIVHGYDAIEFTIVWDIIHQKVPTLLAEIEELLKEPENE